MNCVPRGCLGGVSAVNCRISGVLLPAVLSLYNQRGSQSMSAFTAGSEVCFQRVNVFARVTIVFVVVEMQAEGKTCLFHVFWQFCSL